MSINKKLSETNSSEDLEAFIEDALTENEIMQAIADELNGANRG